jgi:hypothetical protein
MAPRAVVVFGSVAHNADMPSPQFAWLAALESGVCQSPAPAVHRTAGGSLYVLPPLGVHRVLGLRRPTHLATRPLGDVIDAGDGVFRGDPAGRLLGDAAERRDLAPRLLGAVPESRVV